MNPAPLQIGDVVTVVHHVYGVTEVAQVTETDIFEDKEGSSSEMFFFAAPGRTGHRALALEGRTWVRGALTPDSPEANALLASVALLRSAVGL